MADDDVNLTVDDIYDAYKARFGSVPIDLFRMTDQDVLGEALELMHNATMSGKPVPAADIKRLNPPPLKRGSTVL